MRNINCTCRDVKRMYVVDDDGDGGDTEAVEAVEATRSRWPTCEFAVMGADDETTVATVIVDGEYGLAAYGSAAIMTPSLFETCTLTDAYIIALGRFGTRIIR